MIILSSPSRVSSLQRTKSIPTRALVGWTLYDRDGYRSYFAIGFNLILSGIGTRAVFSQEKYYVRKVWRPPPDERYCFTRTGQPNTMDTFRDMVRFARQSGVNVRFFLEPQHARLMLALQDAGLWPQFEDWKRDVVESSCRRGQGERGAAVPAVGLFRVQFDHC